MRIARLSEAAVDVAVITAELANPRVGALATFVGVVRNHDPAVAGEVTALEYSAHPNAAGVLEAIVDQCTDSPTVHGVAAVHRVGRLNVGEAALVVAVAAEHRAEAQDLCQSIVETIKATVPVWKKEHLVDGTHEWVGWS